MAGTHSRVGTWQIGSRLVHGLVRPADCFARFGRFVLRPPLHIRTLSQRAASEFSRFIVQTRADYAAPHHVMRQGVSGRLRGNSTRPSGLVGKQGVAGDARNNQDNMCLIEPPSPSLCQVEPSSLCRVERGHQQVRV